MLSKVYAAAALMVACLGITVRGYAADVNLYVGGGPELNGEQSNMALGVDLNGPAWPMPIPYHFFSFGSGLTYLSTDVDEHSESWVFSVYPQIRVDVPMMVGRWQPFVVAQFLGPSYLSSRQLGSREQGAHFTFRDMIGAGFHSADRSMRVYLSWRHFSNGYLASPNDGFNVPVGLNFEYALP